MNNVIKNSIPLILFLVLFILFNYNGIVIDNDTIEYIKFAQDLENGNFPTSPFYQPGVGFFVYIVSKICFCDLLTAFSIVNFSAGLGLVWVLSGIWSMQREKQGLKLYLASLPAVLYLSSLLYADIVFDFFAFFTVYNLLKYAKTNIGTYLLIASVLAGISIFVKYNGIALMLLGVLFIVWFHYRSGKLRLAWKPVLLYVSFPALYLIFWKIYNGRLGLVEFTNYFKKVDLACILYFTKLNTLSFYRLVIDRFTLGLTQTVSHWYLIGLLLAGSAWLLKTRTSAVKAFLGKAMKSHVVFILVLFIVLYACAVTAMHSMNCYSEPCVRLYSVPFIGTAFLLLLAVSGLPFFETKRALRYLLICLVILYQAAVIYRLNHEVDDNRIKKENAVYDEAMVFLKSNSHGKIVKGHATTAFNRYWFAKSGKFQAMSVFPYQRHHDQGEHYFYPDAEYKNMIISSQSSLNEDEILLIEFADDFMKKHKIWVEQRKPIWQLGNTYIFTGIK